MFTYCLNNPTFFMDSAGTRAVCRKAEMEGSFAPPPPSKKSISESISDVCDSLSSYWNCFLEFVQNENEQVVLDATHLAFYKGKLVIKVPGKSAGFSCGIIFIGSNVSSAETIKHEYGHTKQLDSLGLPAYICTVVVPSVICFELAKTSDSLNKYYFSLPWERKADELGGATDNYLPGSGLISDLYWGYSKMISRLPCF